MLIARGAASQSAVAASVPQSARAAVPARMPANSSSSSLVSAALTDSTARSPPAKMRPKKAAESAA